MNTTIRVDRQHLYYSDGRHELTLSVEWSGVAKTGNCPIDFEIFADDLETWTKPAGEPIDDSRREQLLDEISLYYSKGPMADIVGKSGKLVRGVSTFRFALQIPPTPSVYYEVGKFLTIPLAPTAGARQWNKKYVMDFTGIEEWTFPRMPLDPAHLKLIAERIVRRERIGVMGLPLS